MFGVERFWPTVAIFATRFGAQGEEVGSGGGVATRVRASLQEPMVERLRGGVGMPGGKCVSSATRVGHRITAKATLVLDHSVTIKILLLRRLLYRNQDVGLFTVRWSKIGPVILGERDFR